MQNRQVRDELGEFLIDNRDNFYRLAFSYVKDCSTAMDMVQDAIVKAMEKVETLRNPEYMKTWFYRILVNTCLMYLRKEKRISIVEFTDSNTYACLQPISENIFEELDRGEIFRAIETLDINLKTVLFLRYYEEMKLEDIAQITKTNVNTVKSRLYRAISKLKNILCNIEQGGE